MKKSGFITLAGRPNVGKSSLLNLLIGQKVAIVSPKPQTTRNRILAVLTEGESQAVFLDTPGMHRPQTRLGEYMVKAAGTALDDVDIVLLVVEPKGAVHPIEAQILEHAEKNRSAVVLAVNKTDVYEPAKIAETIAAFAAVREFDAVVPVSAKRNDGIDILKGELMKLLPEGPWHFDEDTLTDQPERQMVAEIIREKALAALSEEIPHGIAVEIERFHETETKTGEELIEIEAAIFCEKDSHKGIIIGKGGATLKKISTPARVDCEKLLGCKVFLKTFVKVREGWRNNNTLLNNFGYNSQEL